MRKGDKPLEIKWLKDIQSLNDKYNLKFNETHEYVISTLTIQSIQKKESGLYLCQAVNPFGFDYASIQLIVRGKPKSQ